MRINDLLEKIYPSLELVSDPFQEDEDKVKFIAECRDKGLIRRYGAVIDLRRAGFGFNAMVCWDLAREKEKELSQILTSFPQVSHCYFRRTYPEWPYAFYTMIHARSEDQFVRIKKRLAQALGNPDHKVLQTLKEYKKQRQKIDFSKIDL